ncbi:MAG TPA: divalent metal cation transporter [Dyella sp.]|nr:divalent metal cation transporter [Dyella sp.]
MPETAPRPLSRRLGAGLIAGAADDDPSGIATYSQAGAQFGLAPLWSLYLTLPLMIGIQMVSAEVGRVTGRGLAANMREYFPRWLTVVLVALLLGANIFNLAADIGAIGEAAAMLLGGSAPMYALGLSLASMTLEVVVPFPRYAPALRLLTLSLFAYVLTAMVVDVPWRAVLAAMLWPQWVPQHGYLLMLVAIFGTTISPYVFFWQASQEVEEERAAHQRPLRERPLDAPVAFGRIRFDTAVGMLYSNAVAFFIMLTAAVVLHPHGVTDIQSSADAARALRPLAGPFAGALFALGILGTGLLALPVLAGSAAYAVAEVFQWSEGLGRRPGKAPLFYLILVGAMLLGLLLSYSPINPIRMLFWSAVLNGVIAVPLMAGIMAMASRRSVMGELVISRPLRWLGWLATLAMAAVVLAMLPLWG